MRFSCLTVFLLYIMTQTLGKDDSYKNRLADAIIRRLYNITVNAFANGTAEEKEKAWHIFENKLKTVSLKRYGPNTGKYIDLIMRGIKSMTSNTTALLRPLNKAKAVRKSDNNNKILPIANTNNLENKKVAVQNIANKVDQIAKGYYNKTIDKKHVIENIKHKILDLIIRKHNAPQGHSDIKTLSQRLANEIESVVETVIANYSKLVEKEIENEKSVMRSENHLIFTAPPSVDDNIRGVTSTVNCDALTEKVCTALKFANKLVCPLDGKKISIEKLCDGVNDCVDRYDERDCIQQAINKIKDARRLITNIEETVIKSCASTHMDNSLLSKQNDILGSVLQSELSFLRKHSSNDSDETFRNEIVIKKTVNEVALVLSSLSIGLEGSLCPRYYGQDESDLLIDHKNILSLSPDDKNDPFEDLPPQRPQAKQSLPNKCVCQNGFCTEINCSHMCRLVCWQKHSLGHWGCQAIDGSTSVSLGVLCDGKTDCYDQSDEEECSIGDISRFEAITIFDNVLTDLTTRAQISDMQPVRNNLLALRAAVSYLQKVATQPKPPADHVRTVRDLCFSNLIATYNKALSKGNIQNLDDIHHYLLSLNQKLISALKRSHTGNDKIVTLEGCYCNKNRCAMARCSRKCERACSVEPQFIRYSCDGTPTSNVFVPSHAICNGKENCPKGEDELDCKKESCRAHHLMLLRHDLSSVGDKEKGTALGAVLSSWKTKVQTTLLVAEGNGRPTLAMVRDVADSITRDLVATYSTLASNKTESNTFRIFFDLSQRTLRVIKSCQ